MDDGENAEPKWLELETDYDGAFGEHKLRQKTYWDVRFFIVNRAKAVYHAGVDQGSKKSHQEKLAFEDVIKEPLDIAFDIALSGYKISRSKRQELKEFMFSRCQKLYDIGFIHGELAPHGEWISPTCWVKRVQKP